MTYFFRVAFIFSLVITSLYVTPAVRAQDQPDCCFQIYSTGRFLGWGAALLEYTRPRNAPSQFDEIIFRQLQEASNTLASSYNSCDGFIEAWPSWRQKQSWLDYQISELQKDINHQFKRGRVYKQVAQTYATWGNELSIMKVDGKYVHYTTCATCYFRLGYASAYISQALRQADEAANRNNNWHEAERQMKLAREHLQRMVKILRSYREVQQPKGSFIVRCAYLDNLDLGNRIAQLDDACRSIYNVTGAIQKANLLSDDIGRVLLEDCFPPWNNNNNDGNGDNNNNNGGFPPRGEEDSPVAGHNIQGNSFIAIMNAGIPGYNKEVYNNISLARCKQICTECSWCKSVDFEREIGRCFVQPVNKFDTKLKTDYPNNPYDHYYRVED